MATTRKEYDEIAAALREFKSGDKPPFAQIALALGSTEHKVRAVWTGEMSRPKPRLSISKRAKERDFLYVLGERMKEVKPKQCVSCHRVFNLMSKKGVCLECKLNEKRTVQKMRIGNIVYIVIENVSDETRIVASPDGDSLTVLRDPGGKWRLA